MIRRLLLSNFYPALFCQSRGVFRCVRTSHCSGPGAATMLLRPTSTTSAGPVIPRRASSGSDSWRRCDLLQHSRDILLGCMYQGLLASPKLTYTLFIFAMPLDSNLRELKLRRRFEFRSSTAHVTLSWLSAVITASRHS